MSNLKIFTAGIIKENPTYVLFLGMCPALGITTKVENAIGMGIAVIFVMTFSNIIVSIIRKIIMDEIRIPVFIIIIAALVTVLEMGMRTLTPDLYEAMKVFIPLIVANCLPLARLEAFAQHNGVFKSILDAVGMGIGFTIGLTSIAFFRELLGFGTILDMRVIPVDLTIPAFTSAVGSFLTFGILVGCVYTFVRYRQKKAGLQPTAGATSAIESEVA